MNTSMFRSVPRFTRTLYGAQFLRQPQTVWRNFSTSEPVCDVPANTRSSPIAGLSQDVKPKLQRSDISQMSANISDFGRKSSALDKEPEYHLNVYSHKHNTHITLTRPNYEPMISFSCGNIGLRKAQRKTYDAAHQLSSYTLSMIQERGFLLEIKKLEVVLRGFGVGREAFTKALLGSEGRNIRHLVSKVTDGTRLKFGGPRSRQTRRLG